jgi:hypothetical protein
MRTQRRVLGAGTERSSQGTKLRNHRAQTRLRLDNRRRRSGQGTAVSAWVVAPGRGSGKRRHRRELRPGVDYAARALASPHDDQHVFGALVVPGHAASATAGGAGASQVCVHRRANQHHHRDGRVRASAASRVWSNEAGGELPRAQVPLRE